MLEHTRKKGKTTYMVRLRLMAEHFRMTLPLWATGEKSLLSQLRNEAVHEGLLNEEPLGFALHQSGAVQTLLPEMQALMARLILGTLGGRDTAAFIQTPVNTRQKWPLIFG